MRPEPERKIAYIAGALNADANQYTKNIHIMNVWAEKIRKLGYAVFIPGNDLLFAVIDGTLSYDNVFTNSQPFLQVAHIMFVCPGWEQSKGTAKELVTAKEYGVSIYYEEDGYQELVKLRKEKEDNERMQMKEWIQTNKKE